MHSLWHILFAALGLSACSNGDVSKSYISKPSFDSTVYVPLASIDSILRLDVAVANGSDSTVTFYISPAEYDFASYASLINSIIDSADTDKEKADKLLAFLYKYTDHSKSAMHERLPHDPLRLVNSFQSGLCDDRNTALSKLFMLAGMPSRVWHLGGHVVCEVYYDEDWHMYDADWGTSFNLNDVPQSVAYIGKHIDIIKLDKKHCALIREWIAPRVLKRVYGTTENNHVNEWFGQVELNYVNRLTLNPGDALTVHSERQIGAHVLRRMLDKYAVIDTRRTASLIRLINVQSNNYKHSEHSPYAIKQIEIKDTAGNSGAMAVYYSCDSATWVFKGMIGAGSKNVTFVPIDANGEALVFNYYLKFVAENNGANKAKFVLDNSILFSEKVLANGLGFKVVPLHGNGKLSLQVEATQQ